jgi:HEAT repeat protein
MIRFALPLIGTAILASGCVSRDAPDAGARPASPPASQRGVHAAPVIRNTTEAVPTREAMPPARVLAQALRASPDPELRRDTVYALADVDDEGSAAVIGEALYDPDPGVREAAIEAMTGIDDAAAADWLSLGLGDPEPRVRRAAVEALGEIGGDTARFLLTQALGDADAGVREAAAQMLAEPEFAQPALQ